MGDLVCRLFDLYLIALFIRVILSWFPITPGTFMAQAYDVLYTITEPLLGPIRRMIPPLGAIDISPIVAIIVVRVVSSAVCSAIA